MRKSRTIDEKTFQKVSNILTAIDSPTEMRAFLEELLTPAEIRDITLRWQLLERLALGTTQRQIAKDLRISLCKITRGARILKQRGAVTARLLDHPSTNPK